MEEGADDTAKQQPRDPGLRTQARCADPPTTCHWQDWVLSCRRYLECEDDSASLGVSVSLLDGNGDTGVKPLDLGGKYAC